MSAMKLFNILAILITLSVGFSYINHRFIKLPTTIGRMVIALLVSPGLMALGPLGFGLKEDVRLLIVVFSIIVQGLTIGKLVKMDKRTVVED
jgi:hypothetical protein